MSISTDVFGADTKSKIVECVRNNEGISRLKIGELTGLSNATVTRVVESLISNDDILEEKGCKSMPRGRPRQLLYFKGHDKYIIGIDLGTTYIRGTLSDYNAESIKEMEIVTEADKNIENVLEKLVYVIETLERSKLVNKNNIKCIGIAVAGMITDMCGIIEYSPAFGWRNINLMQLLKTKLRLPFYYDNVSRLMALGEQCFGKGKDYKNFIMINVGYGIGAGIVINGKLFYGTNGITGELGHYPMKGDNLIRCTCGNFNCLSSYSSGDAIAKRALLKLNNGERNKLKKISEKNSGIIDAELIARACTMEDKLSLGIYNDSMKYLGLSIAGLINIFNPEIVFIGGGVALSGPVFWNKLLKTIKNNLIYRDMAKCNVEPVTYPRKSAIIGAVALALREALYFNL